MRTVEEYNASMPIPVRLVFSKQTYDHDHSTAIFVSVKAPDWKKDLWRAGANLPGQAGPKFSSERNDEIRWFLIRSFWRHLGAA